MCPKFVLDRTIIFSFGNWKVDYTWFMWHLKAVKFLNEGFNKKDDIRFNIYVSNRIEWFEDVFDYEQQIFCGNKDFVNKQQKGKNLSGCVIYKATGLDWWAIGKTSNRHYLPKML